jgi:glutathione S-transferase
MLTLYWSPRAASEAAMAALNEVGAEYRAEKIDMKAGEHKSPEYIKINPNGLVPALKLGDGRVMFETAAMVLYLVVGF